MTVRNRVFVGILLIYVLGVIFLLYRIIADLDPRYRESAEESVLETSHVLASVIERDMVAGRIQAKRLRPVFEGLYSRHFDAQIYALHKTRIELRAYVTDRHGRVVFDSRGRDQGRDFSDWRDVKLTLEGKYGARTTRDVPDDPRTSVIYVAAPIYFHNRIVGVVTVGKPVRSFGQFVEASREKIIELGIGSLVAVLLLVVIVSVWLVHPFAFAADFVRYARTQRGLNLSRLGRRALGTFGAAYQEMRDALAGRHQVSEYVQTLTHEIKGPLSAIRGAAELLQEKMPEAERRRFTANIARESQRIQELVDRLLELAALETRHRLDRVETVDLRELIGESLQAAQPAARRRGVEFAFAPGGPVLVEGNTFLLQRALANLIDNAVEFSPAGGAIDIDVEVSPRDVEVSVRDRGPGVPEYAHARIFDKFFSLARPHSNKKSTGLGLAFVREVAQLHRGWVSLTNASEGGAVAKLHLPRG